MKRTGRKPKMERKKPQTLAEARRHGREMVRTMIVEVAEQLLTDVPFDQLSVRRLAEGAKMSAPALYRYIRGKPELFMFLVGAATERIREAIAAAAHPRRSLSSDLVRIADAYVDCFEAAPNMIGLVIEGPRAPLGEEITQEFLRWVDTISDEAFAPLEETLRHYLGGDRTVCRQRAFFVWAAASGVLVQAAKPWGLYHVKSGVRTAVRSQMTLIAAGLDASSKNKRSRPSNGPGARKIRVLA